MKEREDAHKAELKKERDEVSRLKTELEKAQSHSAELKKVVAEEKQLRADEAETLKESFEQTELRATSAQQELQALKDKSGRWLLELTKINNEMTNKPPLLFYFLADIRYMPSSSLSWRPLFFLQSNSPTLGLPRITLPTRPDRKERRVWPDLGRVGHRRPSDGLECASVTSESYRS